MLKSRRTSFGPSRPRHQGQSSISSLASRFASASLERIPGVAFQAIIPSEFTKRMASPASSNFQRIRTGLRIFCGWALNLVQFDIVQDSENSQRHCALRLYIRCSLAIYIFRVRDQVCVASCARPDEPMAFVPLDYLVSPGFSAGAIDRYFTTDAGARRDKTSGNSVLISSWLVPKAPVLWYFPNSSTNIVDPSKTLLPF
jgi:hypothetical protein